MNSTTLFDISDIKSANISKTLDEVITALEMSGYHPINQLVGYLISGDPGYITSRMDARSKIVSLDRSEILEEVLKGYLSTK